MKISKRTVNFIVKIVCFAMILLFLRVYQVRATEKAELEAENQAQVEAAEEHNKEVQAQMAADQGIAEEGFYKDGTYTGEGQGYGGTIETEITVEDGFITEISVLKADGEDPVYLKSAEKVLDSMVDEQSNDVDTVSGATFSSAGLIESAGDAMQKAVE